MNFAVSASAGVFVPRRVRASVASRRTLTRGHRTPVIRAASDDEAQDSSAYRSSEPGDGAGMLGKLVSNLPDGRKETAPESYGARPASKTLTEGRYRRPPPERVGGVTEQAVRGDDFEVVEGPSFGVGTLVGILVAVATLGGAYLTVTKLGEGPVKKNVQRMPERDTAMVPREVNKSVAEAPGDAAEAPSLEAKR